MGDIEIIVTAISNLNHDMTEGFNRVYDEIGGVCSRVEILELDKAARKAAEEVKKEAMDVAEKLQRREEDKHVNWYKVRQGAIVAACSSITVMALTGVWIAVRFLTLNLDKWVK